jgi:uncharacterized protein (UPF0210 family)
VKLYDQIVAILRDPDHVSPIIPQLIFPDPEVIAAEIVPDAKHLFSLIKDIWDSKLFEIDKLIDPETKNIIEAETKLLNDGYLEIDQKITSEVKYILRETKIIIEKVIINQTIQLKNIITNYHENTKNEIDKITRKYIKIIEKNIIAIQNRSLAQMLKEIGENDKYVIDFMHTLLC